MHQGAVHKVHACDAQHHAGPVLAARRLHWPTGPVEYCHPCADWMQQVADTLGVHVHEEPLPGLPDPDSRPLRGISLDGLDKEG